MFNSRLLLNANTFSTHYIIKIIVGNLLCILFCFISNNRVYAQGCCSGGSGSPIAGGTSQGVLLDRQIEISTNYQYINSKKFLSGTKDTSNFLDNYNSQYFYTRFAYGLTKNLTMSLESGYYLNRSQVGLHHSYVQQCSGIGDLILFPRYDVYNHNTEKTRNEITLGLGLKLPLGKYLDSFVTYTDPHSKRSYYAPMAPAVMPSTGSNDFIFYGFGYRGYPSHNFRIFTSLLYVKKGWNALGEKFGDYSSIGIFAGKTFFRKLGITFQLKGEWVETMKTDKNVDLTIKYFNINYMKDYYGLDVNSTGGKKILFVPQVNYSYKSLSVYALSEFPLYQYVNGTAIASQYLFTIGIAYRFMTVKVD